mmetsp:Transcript_6926/g.15356  ORF Transcript_6926/g.15356 Transcript_6926/m.15356 type:complete len:143 (+) Transcript_6926:416-844(+)
MHHAMHGSTAFDAHVYGSGLPEEWAMLMMELWGTVLLGVPPPSVTNWFVIYTSWTNKTGHTRVADGRRGQNNHADHHTEHIKNYGIFSIAMDLLFETNAPPRDGSKHGYGDYTVDRSEETGLVTLSFTATDTHKGSTTVKAT